MINGGVNELYIELFKFLNDTITEERLLKHITKRTLCIYVSNNNENENDTILFFDNVLFGLIENR